AVASQALMKTELEGLVLIPSHKNLIGANIELVSAGERGVRRRPAACSGGAHFAFWGGCCPAGARFLSPECPCARGLGPGSDASRVLCPGRRERIAGHSRASAPELQPGPGN